MTRYSELMEYGCPHCKMESNSWETVRKHAKQSHGVDLPKEAP
jgi:hypothetical protein